MPIEWQRTYCSSLDGCDAQGAAPLGARWITPYTTRIDQAADGSLQVRAADGRTHRFARLASPNLDDPNPVAASHYNAIEDLTLGRVDDGQLILGLGNDFAETYELAPQFIVAGQPRTRNRAVSYRLVSQVTRAGHRTELSYRPDGTLADIVCGETHVRTEIDPRGRIASLWQVREGHPARQLAAYTYEEQEDGSSDLVMAEDEDRQARTYEYLRAGAPPAPGEPRPTRPSTHLLSRYTDRTGRAMHLRWMHEDGFATAITPANSTRARAYRESADDGSLDVTLIWNRHIRLVTVIDAMGAETRRYFDLLGYTYRIVHPEVQASDGQRYAHQEWFFRDDRKNLITHLHPDGSVDQYAYDDRSNRVRHLRPDGRAVHYAYDELDNLTGIRDGEGQVWKRAYDGVNLVEETDPLGHTTAYAYDGHSRPVEITDAKGGQQQLEYDTLGQLVSHTDCSGKQHPAGPTTSAAGCSKTRDALFQSTTKYHYDGRPVGERRRIPTSPYGAVCDFDAGGPPAACYRDALLAGDPLPLRRLRPDLASASTPTGTRSAMSGTGSAASSELAQRERPNVHRFDLRRRPASCYRRGALRRQARTDYDHDPATGVLRWDPPGRTASHAGHLRPARAPGRARGRASSSRNARTGPTARSSNAAPRIDPASVRRRSPTSTTATGGSPRRATRTSACSGSTTPPGGSGAEHHHYLIDETGTTHADPAGRGLDPQPRRTRHPRAHRRARTATPSTGSPTAADMCTACSSTARKSCSSNATTCTSEVRARPGQWHQGSGASTTRSGRLKSQLIPARLNQTDTDPIGHAAPGSPVSLRPWLASSIRIDDSKAQAASIYRYDPVRDG